MNVTFSLNYHKNQDTTDILTCADIVKLRFEGIAGSLIGLERLKEIQPSDLAKITAAYSSTPLDGLACADGELVQDYVCSTFL